MSCNGCERNVESALTTLEGVSDMAADHEDDVVEVVVDDVTADDLHATIRETGEAVPDAVGAVVGLPDALGAEQAAHSADGELFPGDPHRSRLTRDPSAKSDRSTPIAAAADVRDCRDGDGPDGRFLSVATANDV